MKLADYFFTIIDEENASLENRSLFTSVKEYATLIKSFGPMYMNFDEYPPYSGAISENFETNINVHIWCDHGLPYPAIK